ncbi:hypothetical protein SRIMM317S_06991 [Streptomyces rimosus subsp. rimosus]
MAGQTAGQDRSASFSGKTNETWADRAGGGQTPVTNRPGPPRLLSSSQRSQRQPGGLGRYGTLVR